MREVLLLAVISVAAALQILHLNEGDKCKDGPPPWYCKSHLHCPGIYGDIKKHIFPKICSFKGRGDPIVCCPSERTNNSTANKETDLFGESLATWDQPKQPPENLRSPPLNSSDTSRNMTQSKSDRMCKEYAKYVFKEVQSFLLFDTKRMIDLCGRVVSPLIVGGSLAGPREFPHMARIGYGNVTEIQWLCGGSLISERFILSAAHCTEPAPNVLAEWANLGDLDTSTNEDDADPVTIKIIERINHPGYRKEQLYNDIALYKLEQDAPLGAYIRPICLNTKDVTAPAALASGWGHNYWKGNATPELLKVSLPVASNKHCRDSYQSDIGINLQIPEGIISDYMICAGGEKYKDTCQGDSGGPLQIPLNTPYCMYSLIGVTSFGKGCGYGFPGVYTKVSYYIKWIEDIVWTK